MRRWNGWGEESVTYPLPAAAIRYMQELVGEVPPIEEASFTDVLAQVGQSRLPGHPLITTDAEVRLRHARGQSVPDWIAMRSGRVGVFPDGVATPASDEDVRSLLAFARETGVKLIPYGGGTSVVGHINPLAGKAPVLTVDMCRMNRLLDLDETSHLATFEAGVTGPEIERQLTERGFTLGHFPQSFELSTLGGWIVTRSSGQQSYHYGRIENLFAGGHLETPAGEMELPPYPASAAGPDLKQVILGSEGRLGVVTRAIVRIRRLPEVERFYGVFFHTWEDGAAAVREIAQEGVGVSMLRLSNAMETTTTLALSGKDTLVKWAELGLKVVGFDAERSLLVFGVTGRAREVRDARKEALEIMRAHGGFLTGEAIGKMWKKSRFSTPYMRNSLWEQGYALDTLETAVPWEKVVPTALETQKALREGLQESGERVLVFAHISHVYNDGALIYITYAFRRDPDADETLRRWQVLKGGASRTIVAHGGTISHQHGVGLDHAPYLEAEKGSLGMRTLESLIRLFDPDQVMNPGKLLQLEREVQKE